jgi:hypothetical protein
LRGIALVASGTQFGFVDFADRRHFEASLRS